MALSISHQPPPAAKPLDTSLREFLASHFVAPNEEFYFHGGAVSQEVLANLKRALRNVARECIEIIERDRSPPEARHGAAPAFRSR